MAARHKVQVVKLFKLGKQWTKSDFHFSNSNTSSTYTALLSSKASKKKENNNNNSYYTFWIKKINVQE